MRFPGTLVALALAALPARAEIVLFDPAAPLDGMAERRFEGRTEWRIVPPPEGPALRAVPRDSAAMLYRERPFRLVEAPIATWRWRVERGQAGADLAVRDREDFAAALFFVFGEASLFAPESRVLIYAWSGDPAARTGAVVPSPRRPERVRSIVLRAGAVPGLWRDERRDLAADYRAAFGEAPPERVSVIALMTDNDQTGEPAEALYGAVAVGPR